MKATPIPISIPIATPPAPAPKRRELSDYEYVPRKLKPVDQTRVVPYLRAICQRLMAMAGMTDDQLVHGRVKANVSIRRAIAVTLRRYRHPGHDAPASYPEIAHAMGRSGHSSIIAMCQEHYNDPDAVVWMNKMEVLMEALGCGKWPMSVVAGSHSIAFRGGEWRITGTSAVERKA